MVTAAISDIKNRLSYFLRLVKNGETVIVTDHARPVAELRQILNLDQAGDQSRDDHLNVERRRQLVGEGVILAARKTLDVKAVLTNAISCDVDAVDMLISMRGDR